MMMALTVLFFGFACVYCSRDLQVFSNPVTNATRFVENSTIIEGNIDGEQSSTPGSYAVGFGQISQNQSGATSGNLLQTQNIQASDVIAESLAVGNIANAASNNRAVSGNNQTVANVVGSTLSLTEFASDNRVYAGQTAVAGNYQNIGDITNSTVFLRQNSVNNRANVEGGTAVAGNRQSFSSLVDSRLQADLRAQNNYVRAAENAIAGNEVILGDITDSDLDLNVAAIYNYAYSTNADAVSGSRVLLPSEITELNLNLTENNFRNRAYAPNGNAIIDFRGYTSAARKLMKHN
eukprot:TRINITY_DN12993_c0_g2_i1.p2 TRINITY_DN12993_c0_g2~~TRINITY_DN12993_c0_g2_i1.p2  ORF type:complete len:293 (-),score=37.68 TRINITY_DN12993_c0_g2_i1:853-1731(-)